MSSLSTFIQKHNNNTRSQKSYEPKLSLFDVWLKSFVISAFMLFFPVYFGALEFSWRNTSLWVISLISSVASLIVLYNKLSTGHYGSQGNKAIVAVLGLWFFPSLVMLLLFWIGPYYSGFTEIIQKNLGTVTQDKSLKIPSLDIEKAPLVPVRVALMAAEKKLSDVPSMGSQFVVGKLTKQIVKDKLVWVAFLEPKNDFFVWKSIKGSPGYIVVSAFDASDAKLITQLPDNKGVMQPLNLKYTLNSWYHENVLRHAYFNGDMTHRLTSIEAELDDEGRPFWIITTTQPKVLGTARDLYSVMVVDPQTGEIKSYQKDNTPEWIDRVYPERLIYEQVSDWGEFINGRFNWEKKDLLTPSSSDMVYVDHHGSYIISLANQGKTTGITGFLLINSRTKEVTRYNLGGASEESAMLAAVAVIPEKKYRASGAIPFMVDGTPTYLMTLSDDSGVVRAYGMVDIENFRRLAVRDTLAATYEAYSSLPTTSTLTDVNASANPNETVEVSGEVSRIGQDAGSRVFTIKLKNDPVLYIASHGFGGELVITKENDFVIIGTIKSNEDASNKGTLPVHTFKNNSLK